MEKYWIDGGKRFKEQKTISTSSLKVMKNRKRKESENTISLGNLSGESVGLRPMGSPFFYFRRKLQQQNKAICKNCIAKRLACSRGLGMCHQRADSSFLYKKALLATFVWPHHDTIEDGAARRAE